MTTGLWVPDCPSGTVKLYSAAANSGALSFSLLISTVTSAAVNTAADAPSVARTVSVYASERVS